MPGFSDVNGIINETSKELGLVTSDIADPFASTNQLIVQLTALIRPTGRELAKLHPWSHLQREGTFNTVAATASYSLDTVAADFGRIIDQTEWNRTRTMPAPNGVSPKQWAQLKGTTAAGVDKVLRIMQEKIFVHPTPTAVETIAFEYISRRWGAAAFVKEYPTAAADVVQFDAHLFTRALMLRFLTKKGMATQAEVDDYNDAFALATGGDGAAPTLSITPSSSEKLVDGVPETGFGS